MSANIRETRIAVSAQKQTALQTPLTAAECVSFTKLNAAMSVVDMATENDAAEIGKGNEFAANNYKSHWNVTGAFEKYIHADDSLPPLVRAGLLHVQFETIHPYLDGNGRIGRLLVTLLLEHWHLLTKPLMYLSLFFKRHRDEYYRRLNAVRVDGDWEGWLDFFLDGVATMADEAVASARELFALVAVDRERVLAHGGVSLFAVRLFELLPRHPIVTVASVMALVETTKPTAGRAIELLVAAGVLAETTGKKRDRSYVYRGYLDRLRVGTELEGALHR